MTELYEANTYDVEFMNLVVDKADNLRVVDSDNHFSKFSGVHPSKIKQGKAYLLDFIMPVFREDVMKALCKKDSPYVYFSAQFIDKDNESVNIYCTAQNFNNSTLCRLTLADVSKSQLAQEQLKQQAEEKDHIIDMINGGVCLFKVTADMHIEVEYLNEGACRFFGVTKASYNKQKHRLDELIYPEDKTVVFQAIGKAMATDEPIEIEFRTIVHRNEYRWCQFNAAILKYDDENSPIFHAMFTDISKVKEAEKKADLMYEQLSKIFKNLPTPIFSTTVEEPLILNLASEDFINLLGYSRAKLFDEYGGNLLNFINERERNYVEATIRKQIEAGGKISVRYAIKTAGGMYLVVEDNRKIIEQNDGTKSMLCSLTNITESYNRVSDTLDI